MRSARTATHRPGPATNSWLFYGQLADMVRRNAGTEALRLASQEDDYYMGQVNAGVPRQQIMVQASDLFLKASWRPERKAGIPQSGRLRPA